MEQETKVPVQSALYYTRSGSCYEVDIPGSRIRWRNPKERVGCERLGTGEWRPFQHISFVLSGLFVQYDPVKASLTSPIERTEPRDPTLEDDGTSKENGRTN